MSDSRHTAEMTDLLALFRQEAVELLDCLESCLLDLEAQPASVELVDATFRHLHTLKGIASMYGFDLVARIAHGLESAFEQARKGKGQVSGEVIRLALAGHDCMRSLVGGDEHSESGAAVRERAEEIIAGIGRETGTPQHDPEPLDPTDHSGQGVYLINLRPGANALFRGLRPLSILRELRTLGECKVVARTDEVPGLDDLDPGILYMSWDIELTTDAPRSRIEEAFMFLGTEEFVITQAAADKRPSSTEERRTGEDRRRGDRRVDRYGAEDTVRVTANRLDQLVDMVGELATAHGVLVNIASANSDPRVRGIAEDIGRLAEGLRASVLEVRMVPIGTMFGRFRRYVRDLGRELGKDVDFVVEGAETELDKGVLDRISEPVLHILRNSIDHGIEIPEVRLAAGKSARGTITLSASQSTGNVYLKITDDGCGVDLSSVASTVLSEAGVIQAGELGTKELTEILFRPGFSTRQSITNVSGRGVGLDVVRSTIEELRGTVTLKTEPGQGTTIILKLPLTLAIVEGLVAYVADERYIFPLAVVESCVEVSRSDAWREHGRDLIDVQGRLVPLISLRRHFEVQGEPTSAEMAVIVSVDGERFGVAVDAVKESIQAVIKPLSRLLKASVGLSGTTVLGDGQVVPVLDVNGLLWAASDSD